MKDIFTGREIVNKNPEHIIPSGLGGRLTSSELIDAKTNTQFGATIDKGLVEAFQLVRVALGFESSHGKPLAIVPDNTDEYEVVSGLMPRGRKYSVHDNVEGATGEFWIETYDPQQTAQILEGIRRKYKINKLPDDLKIQVDSFYPEPRFTLRLGSPADWRALAKMCFQFSATLLPRDTILSGSFDRIRRWIRHGAINYKTIMSPHFHEEHSPCNHDPRPELWHSLPVLEDSPFQHRLFVFSGPQFGGSWACLELFGHFRFSCVLSEDKKLPFLTGGHLVDPVSGRRETHQSTKHHWQVAEIAQHSVDELAHLVAGRRLNQRLKELAHESALNSLIADALNELGTKMPDEVDDAYKKNWSRRLTEDFVRMMNGTSTKREFSVKEFGERYGVRLAEEEQED